MIVTARARVLLVIAAVTMAAGVFTQRLLMAKFGLALWLWILFEWLLFRYRVDFVVRRGVVRRLLSEQVSPFLAAAAKGEQTSPAAASTGDRALPGADLDDDAWPPNDRPDGAEEAAYVLGGPARKTLWQGRRYQVTTKIQMPRAWGICFVTFADRQPFACDVSGNEARSPPAPANGPDRTAPRGAVSVKAKWSSPGTWFHKRPSPDQQPPPAVAAEEAVPNSASKGADPLFQRPSAGHATSVGPGRFRMDYAIVPAGIGILQFEGVHLAMADLQGLFFAERFLPLRQRYRVFPLTPVAGKPVHWKKSRNQLPPPGIHRFLHPGIGTDLLEIREYQPGDSPRSIAWKVTARRGEFMTKQYESEVPVRCTLLVDVSRSVRVGYPQPTPLDASIRLVTAVVDTVLANRDPVGLGLFDEQRVRVLRPSASRRTAMQMIDYLAEAIGRPLDPVELDLPSGEIVETALRTAREIYPHLYYRAIDGLGNWWWHRTATRQQRELAAVLAAHFRLGISGRAALSTNRFSLLNMAQRFLAEHQIPYPGPVFDEYGRDLFRSPEKIDRAAKLLMSSVRRGRDNELFVIVADLLDLEDHLQPLLQAIKVATARHHRVIVICAWPAAAALPSSPSPPAAAWPPLPGRPFQAGPSLATAGEFAEKIAAASNFQAAVAIESRHRHTAFGRLKSAMARLGVRVVCASDRIAPKLVLTEMELLRGGPILR